MSKGRHRKSEELLLIPFLDILCSLIGILVLIIVVLCVAQSQQTNGRTQEEMDRSKEFVKAEKKLEEMQKPDPELKKKIEERKKLTEESKEKAERAAKMRLLLAQLQDATMSNQEADENLKKELDNLMVEIVGLTKHDEDIKKEIQRLMEEIKAKKGPMEKVVPPVVVQPSGSGLAQGSKLFFIEASGGSLTIYWDQQKKTLVSARDEVVATDPALNYLLKEVANTPQAKLIFLLRDDGMNAYNKAAGWAQATYNYRVDQVGKLLLPGRGPVDLQMFRQFLGTMAPPPEAKLMAPPAGGAAPAPATTPPAAPAGAAAPPKTI